MHVAVVGAGIAGLTLAHDLHSRGVDVTVLESSDDPGGVIQSRRVQDHILELGPQRARLTPDLQDLITDLDLQDDVLSGATDAPLYVYWDGELRTVPRSPRELLTTNLLSWRGKLRLLAEPLLPQRDPTGSAHAHLEHRVGTEAVERILDPLLGGLHGTRLTHQPARPTLDRLLALEEAHGSLLRAALAFRGRETPPPFTLREGLQELPRALAQSLGSRLQLSTPAESMEAAGDGHVLTTPQGDVEADHTVLTTPADVTADLLRHIAPATAGKLQQLRYTPLALVHLTSHGTLDGYGVQLPRREGLRTRGFTWSGGFLPGRDNLTTAFLGGTDDEGALNLSDHELGAIAREDHHHVTGHDATVLHVHRLPRAVPTMDASWSSLTLQDVPSHVHLAANYLGPLGIPSRVQEARELANDLAPARKG